MAAASAGAIQAGFSSGTIASSTSQLQQQHHHSVDPPFINQQTHLVDSPQLTSQPLQYPNNALTSQSHQQHRVQYVTQRINVENYLNVKQQQIINNSPNVAPGWRRQLNDGEIVYFGPSGAALRKIEQIKDYLLSDGTCKCGLPCPFRPEQFFEFNPQVPNLPLLLENGSERPTYCLHHARFTEQQNFLSKGIQPTNFNNCLSSNQKVNLILNNSSNQESVSYSERNDSGESQVESITVSRTPPWRRNSILNQQQQQQQQSPSVVTQTVENASTSADINGRVPPLPQQPLLQSQPPWQEETQKRRNNSKRRPNFKEDPTGYLDQQTAILHNSILNVHSPELQQENESNQSQVAYRQSPMHNGNKNSSRPSADRVNILNNHNLHDSTSEDSNQRTGHQQMSVMQQNQNMYIQQQFDNNIAVPKNQIVIGSNGQQMRIIQNSAHQQPIVYTNSNDYHVNAVNNSSSIHTQNNNLTGSNSKHSVKRTSTILNTAQQVQIQDKQDHFHPIEQLQQSQQLSSLDQFDHHQQQQPIIISQTDQETNELNNKKNEDDNDTMGLPIGVTHLSNGVVQVHHDCDINQVKTQPPISSQTILIKSYPTTTQMGNQTNKLKPNHQYISLTGPKQNMIGRCVPVAQESPVSSSTTMKNIKTDTMLTAIIDKGPAQVGAISTSHESPPISSPDTSHSPDLKLSISKEPIKMTTNQSNIFIAGQTIGKNTITSVVAGKTMTSTTNTGQPSSTAQNDKHRQIDTSNTENIIQIHENGIFSHVNGGNAVNNNEPIRNTKSLKSIKNPSTKNGILKSAQSIHLIKNQSNHIQTANANPNANANANIKIAQTNRTPHSLNVPGNVTLPPSTSQTNLSNIQIQQQPTNQIIMTSSGCQILVMPSQNSKTTNPMIIGQSANTNTLVVNSSTGQQNVVINTPNAQMIGNDLMHSINENGTTHSNIIQNANNNMVIQSPNVLPTGNQNLIQSANNVLTANNGNVVSNNNSNYIVSSPNAMQPMIINGSGLLSHNGNVIHHHPGHQNVIQSSTSNKYWIANQSNVIATNNQFISNNNSGALLSPNNGGLVLNQLSNLSNASYVIQPQSFTTVDGHQMMNVMSSENNGQYVQQTTQQRIILSPDSKRQTKKRKSNSISPQQSPTIQTPSPQTTVLQIAPQYHHHHHQSQSFQTTIEQQILLQNGQTILQPLNLIGQQLLVPAGLMMTQDTVLQIQNMAPCGLIAPQSMVQNKNFLSPNSANQQFIMNGNGQISPIGQVYSTPVVVMPQSNGFVQQTTMINNSVESNSNNNIQTQSITVSTAQTTPIQTVASSPPDTTTHSPRSPERPESQRSNASDVNMVQFVSSSEPDSNVSPIADSAQSPSSDYDRSTNSYQTTIPFKANEAKIRRLQTPTLQYMNHDFAFKMKPDSHESSPSSKKTAPTNASNNVFSLGELVWGPVRGHNYWPGKIVAGPSTATKANASNNNNNNNNINNNNKATCYVQWFGRKSSIEMIPFVSLKSLSDGLDAHHKAQKENRKGRKLNAQLEKAIQEAMIELDRMSSSMVATPLCQSSAPPIKIYRRRWLPQRHRNHQEYIPEHCATRVTRASTAQQRTNKLIKIAPAPPNAK